MGSFVTHLSCPACGRRYEPGRPQGLCGCGSPLLVEYDLDAVAGQMSRDAVRRRDPSLWRYRELLPVEDPGAIVSLGEGFTPLLALPALGRSIGLPALWVKDEGTNPTGTFKARGAAVGMSMARALGIRKVALPSAGNAGGAWACYGAAAGLRVTVVMPSDAPEVNRMECRLHGARVILVDGLISEAGSLIERLCAEEGWFDAGTLKEPYRVEGKKTLGFEIAEQLGWRAPDAIVYPAGGGVGLIGMWRAFGQLAAIGSLKGEAPRLFVTQADGCAPLVRAFEEDRDQPEPWPGARTIAQGLRVPRPLGGSLVLRAIRETGGGAIAVSDEDIVAAMGRLGGVGVSAGPEGAATLAAAERLRQRGDLGARDRVVLVNTGSALKSPEALAFLSGPPDR